MKAAILAGGFGKRLRPFTNEKPKSMLEVAGHPLIERQIQWLKSSGISDLVICVGYLKEKIMDHVGNGSKFGVDVRYSVEERALGTGGAIKNAEHMLSSEDFFVINGDILTTIDPGRLVGDTHAVSAVPMRNPFGVIITKDDSESSYVAEFLQKPVMNDVWINAGMYYFKNEVFDYLPRTGDFEASVLPMLARRGKLKAVRFAKSYWRSIDSHRDLEEASKEIKAS